MQTQALNHSELRHQANIARQKMFTGVAPKLLCSCKLVNDYEVDDTGCWIHDSFWKRQDFPDFGWCSKCKGRRPSSSGGTCVPCGMTLSFRKIIVESEVIVICDLTLKQALYVIYHLEQNIELCTFWDSGYMLKFGDESNGYTRVAPCDILSEVEDELRAWLIAHFEAVKKKMKHTNNLTAAEHERLALLNEELGETIHIIGKILRHGYIGVDLDDITYYNRMLLEEELGDISFAINLMVHKGDVDSTIIEQRHQEKKRKIPPYLHYNTIDF